MRTAPILLLLAIAGCGGVNVDKWPEKAAKSNCEFYERCNTTFFYSDYSDVDACIAESEAALNAEAVEKVGCVFDEDNAKECLKALGGSCKKAGEQAETWFTACASVYACPGGTTVGGDTGS